MRSADNIFIEEPHPRELTFETILKSHPRRSNYARLQFSRVALIKRASNNSETARGLCFRELNL